MGKVYDDWGRLVEAVVRREKLLQLCYAHSMSSSDSIYLLDDDSLHLQQKMTMMRLEEELIYSLAQNKQCFEHGYMSLPACPVYEESIVLVDASPRQSSSSDTDQELVLDLLDPEMVPRIKSIANIMFASNYDEEFCEAFVRFGRGAFDVYLTILDVEELNSEDILQMEWRPLNSIIRKWSFAIKKFFGPYLAKGKLVFDQVLGEYGHISSRCLIEASKPSLMWFLNFGSAVAVGPHKPEWFFSLLDMHEVLLLVSPFVEALFPDNLGSCIRIELDNLLTRLRDCVKAILMELGNAICAFSIERPFANGGIHPRTRYVINYILCFEEYVDSLNLILREKDGDEDLNADVGQIISGTVASHLHSFTSTLEAYISDMSNLYDDTSLKHIFVMNNIHFMVEKISNSKKSKIKTCFGDEWFKMHVMKFRFHAQCYQRSTWSSVLPLIRYDGKVDRASMKAKCRKFTVAFENIYKKQTGWFVPDHQLREELRLSTSINVVPAYGNFVSLGDNKHIKYNVHELESLMMDLFENSPKSLSHTQMGRKVQQHI
ncbi:hypothetical protein C2S51_006956 [Perilla frutescens var. frutescens]|nr:hypothetical protein C2S51_006956 [Perilla frutescens var. frutescens]